LARRSWKSRRLEELIPSETSAALQAAPKKKRAKVKGRQRPTTAKTCWASGSFLGIKDVGKEEAECKCLRLQNELYFYPRWSLCLLPSCAQMRGSSEQELGSADDFSGAQMTRQPVKGTQMPAENHELTMAGRCSASPWSAFHPCRILPDTCFSPKAAAGVKGRVLASFWTEVLSQCTWTRPGPQTRSVSGVECCNGARQKKWVLPPGMGKRVLKKCPRHLTPTLLNFPLFPIRTEQWFSALVIYSFQF
jgi:hypothetical protein